MLGDFQNKGVTSIVQYTTYCTTHRRTNFLNATLELSIDISNGLPDYALNFNEQNINMNNCVVCVFSVIS